jgi:hypothetical protein
MAAQLNFCARNSRINGRTGSMIAVAPVLRCGWSEPAHAAWAVAQSSIKRLESIFIFARWGSRFRNASVPTPPDQITRSVLRKSRGESDPMQNWPPKPPGSPPGAIGALTRDPWRSPIDPSVEAPGAVRRLPIYFFGLTIVAALRPDPLQDANEANKDQRFRREAPELVRSITPVMANRMFGCQNLCGLRGASVGEA